MCKKKKKKKKKEAAYQIRGRSPHRTWMGRDYRGCGLLCYGEVRIDNLAGQRFPGLRPNGDEDVDVIL